MIQIISCRDIIDKHDKQYGHQQDEADYTKPDLQEPFVKEKDVDKTKYTGYDYKQKKRQGFSVFLIILCSGIFFYGKGVKNQRLPIPEG